MRTQRHTRHGPAPLGIDYQKNTFPYEGRDESLVGVVPARILNELFA
jgi:hypothetical protein